MSTVERKVLTVGVIQGVLWTLILLGPVRGLTWASNLAVFLIWLAAAALTVMFLMAILAVNIWSDSVKESDRESLRTAKRDVDRTPDWLRWTDRSLDWLAVLALASCGWFATAFFWFMQSAAGMLWTYEAGRAQVLEPCPHGNAPDFCLGCAAQRAAESVVQDMRDSTRLENTDEVLFNVHDRDACEGRPCVIHNRTDHHMRGWPQHYRADRRIMERICPHGVGHPDPDDVRILNGEDSGTHGCDGCCGYRSDPPEENDG